MRTAFCLLSLSAVSSATLAESTPFTQPAGTQLQLCVFELVGPANRLGELTPDEAQRALAGPRARRAGGEGRTPRREPPGDPQRPNVLADFMIDLPVERARLSCTANIPVAEASPREDRRGMLLRYAQVGVLAEITSDFKSSTTETLPLRLNLTVNPAPTSGAPRPAKADYEKSVTVSPDKPVTVRLDDAPESAGEEGHARVRFASVSLGRARRMSATKPHAEPTMPSGESGNTHAQLDCMQLTSSIEEVAGLDTMRIVAAAPDAGQLLKTLSETGESVQTFSGSLHFDAAAGTNVTVGQRAPVVRDVRISRSGEAIPEVTYQEVGTILKIGPMKWEGKGAEARATSQVTVESSGIAATSVIAQGVQLPSFMQWKVVQSQEFRSGVPEYYVLRGPPAAAGPQGNATVYIARLVLTQVR
jgi:hypothetical protein